MQKRIVKMTIAKYLPVIMMIIVLMGCASTPHGDDADKADLENTYGIRVSGIHLSGAGYFLDFRYWVIDPDKASLIVKRDIKPYLIDNESGAVMAVPAPTKLGPLRQTAVKPYKDREYFIMFANPGKYIKKGRKVTVVIGDVHIEDLTVE